MICILHSQSGGTTGVLIKDTNYAWAKNEHLLKIVLLHNFSKTQAIKNLNIIFLTKGPQMKKVGSKLKTDTFQMLLHFLHLWTLCQNKDVQIFKNCAIRKLLDKTSRRCSFFAVFWLIHIASILKYTSSVSIDFIMQQIIHWVTTHAWYDFAF